MQTETLFNDEQANIALTDSHCHLLLLQEQDASKVEAILTANEIDLQILDIGIDPKDWHTRLELCKQATNVYHTAGLHPSKYAKYSANQLLDALEPLVPHAVAVGETGLDWFRMYTENPLQIELFSVQVALAKKYHKPLIIHARESIDDIIAILRKENISSTGSVGIMHCFSGSVAQAKHCLDLGLYISFGANISYSSAETLREVVQYIPNDKILSETDAPYLLHRQVQKLVKKQTKTSFKPHIKNLSKDHSVNQRYNRVNTPLYLYYLYETLAEIRNTSIKYIASLARENFNAFLAPLYKTPKYAQS